VSSLHPRVSFTFSIWRFRLLMSFLATSHVSSRSTPKYSWIRMSLIPAILRQGMFGFFLFVSSGMFLAASPMISILRITASWICFEFRNSFFVMCRVYSSILVMLSSMCSMKISGSLFIGSLFALLGFCP